jgi:hypothetical protein
MHVAMIQGAARDIRKEIFETCFTVTG